MNLCIIPARGGSKRIPRKNIKEFCGKPMIAYAIEAAMSSSLFDHIIVSTEDSEIAAISAFHGAQVPFMRPHQLATDYAGTVEVITDAINECENMGLHPEKVCCIYPCVPLLNAEDLIGALNLLESSPSADYAFPVTEFPSAIQRSLRKNHQGLMSSYYPEYEKVRTQDLEPAYYDVGQFYWGWRISWLTNKEVHNSGAGFLIPSWRVVDIDTDDDWKRAEILFDLMTAKDK